MCETYRTLSIVFKLIDQVPPGGEWRGAFDHKNNPRILRPQYKGGFSGVWVFLDVFGRMTGIFGCFSGIFG